MHHSKLTPVAVFAISLLSTCTEEPGYGAFTSKSGMGTESSGRNFKIIDDGQVERTTEDEAPDTAMQVDLAWNLGDNALTPKWIEC